MGTNSTATVKVLASGDDVIWMGGATCAPGGFWQTVVRGSHTTVKAIDATNYISFGWDTTWTKDGA
jgi:hypothetical protein